MFTPTVRTLICITGILFLISGNPLFSQDAELNLQQLETKAKNSLDEGDFRSALPGFRVLMEADPENVMHSYHVGICLVELNEELSDAIEYLYGASKRGAPSDVNYYLGKAYHRNYNFSSARKYYGRFETEATRQESKDYKPSQLVETTRSATEITATYNPYDVMNVTFIDLFDSLQFSQIKMKGGQLQRKPAAYFHANEVSNGLTSLVFVPRNSVRGDHIYYSGYNRNQKGGAQLFRVKKGSGKSWGDPEEIKALNSEGDELLPYFDPIESNLYFASDGRLGVGGFDLFRTHYDQERDQWSEPVNLGFPVNSAMDEYLLLPGSDLGMVMFFSTREGTDSTITVYRVHLVEPKKKTISNDYKMLQEIATLDGAAGDILAEIEEMRKLEEEMRELEQEGIPPAITEVTVLSEKSVKSEHKYMLVKALRHQANSDSLNNLASNARFLIEDSDDPNDRWVWQKQIMLWEKKARDEELMAENLYAKMEEEQEALNKFYAGEIPETIEVDTVLGDLTIYRYTGVNPSGTDRPAAPTALAQNPPSNQASIPNGIEILDQSPYSRSNPIPMDMPLPLGVHYRIQVGVVGSPAEPDAFQGLSPITGMNLKERGIVKYYAGKFSKYDDAFVALSMIQTHGFEDAFIVSWYNGEIVSTQKAKVLE